MTAAQILSAVQDATGQVPRTASRIECWRLRRPKHVHLGRRAARC